MGFDFNLNITRITEIVRCLDSDDTFWFVFIMLFLAISVLMILFLVRELCCFTCFCARMTAKDLKKKLAALRRSRDQRKSARTANRREDRYEHSVEDDMDNCKDSELTAVISDPDTTNGIRNIEKTGWTKLKNNCLSLCSSRSTGET